MTQPDEHVQSSAPEGALDPFASVQHLAAALRDGVLSSVALTEHYLERIARHDLLLNSVVALQADAALARAREADQARASGRLLGLLHGVPITIKDNIDVQGLATTFGRPERAQALAAHSAPAAQRLLDAGAVLLGKTNLSTDAGDWQAVNALYGRTQNPWDLQRTPGGSTGGGAAALAAGLTALELGTDIGGSIRVPAAYCGLYGHRPSDGIVPRSTPENPLEMLNVHGPLARSAQDLALALEVIAGPLRSEATAWTLLLPPPRARHLADFRVAIAPPLPWLPVDAEIRAALADLAATLRAAGAQVVTAWPEPFGDLRRHEWLYAALMAVMEGIGREDDARAAFSAQMRRSPNRFAAAQAAGAEADAVQVWQWAVEREGFRSAYRDFFGAHDVLLAPVTPVLAFPHVEERVPLWQRTLAVDDQLIHYEQLSVYPGLATLSGQPATVFPWGRSRSGLPIGLQAIGPYLEDMTPIEFAWLLEQQYGGFVRPPAFSD